MQGNKINAFLLIFLVVLVFPQYADAADLERLKGMPYLEAREILISEGWIPYISGSEHLEEDDSRLFGNGRDLWEQGVQEIDACSGTGLGHCVMYFQNSKANKLKVITIGEAFEGDVSQIVVHGLRILKKETV